MPWASNMRLGMQPSIIIKNELNDLDLDNLPY